MSCGCEQKNNGFPESGAARETIKMSVNPTWKNIATWLGLFLTLVVLFRGSK